MIAVRIVVLILISSILTFTTSPTQLTDAIDVYKRQTLRRS